MIIRIGTTLLLLFAALAASFAQSNTEHWLVRANRIEAKLRTKGFVLLGHYVDGFVPVQNKFKKSFVDSNGRLISTLDYTNVRDFNNGFAAAQRADAWTIINRKGEEVFEPKKEFSGIGKVRNGVMIVTSKKMNLAGLARVSGEVILPCRYDFIRPLDTFSGNYLATINGAYILVDSLGKQLSENIYQDFSAEENSTYYAAKLDGGWAILDLKGAPITEFNIPYPYIEAFNNGKALVRKNEKVGYINAGGTLILPLIYDDGFAFNEYGNAPVKIAGDHGMIDSLGNVFLQGPYNLVMQMDSILFRIVDAGSQYVTDKAGKKLWPETAYLIEPLGGNLFKVIPLSSERIPYFANEKGIKIANYGE